MPMRNRTCHDFRLHHVGWLYRRVAVLEQELHAVVLQCHVEQHTRTLQKRSTAKKSMDHCPPTSAVQLLLYVFARAWVRKAATCAVLLLLCGGNDARYTKQNEHVRKRY